jgi:membrane-bound serine protease (ClpP class)
VRDPEAESPSSKKEYAKVLKWVVVQLSFCLSLLAAFFPALAQDQPRTIVYVAPVDGIIDLGLAPFIQRVIDEATSAGAAAVILEINTFGGRVDAAVQIRDALLNSRVRTVAFVNRRAISAGALISLAAETIVMSSGGTIGAATPVQGGGAEAQPVSEKSVSYVRKEFGATAESRKRPVLIAEAMVDTDVAIKGLIEKGKLLTLTTEEALKHKVADLRADTLDDALAKLGLGGAELRRATPNWAENLVRFLTNPVFSSLLITIAMVGIIVELRTPGFGIPGALGVGSLGLFFWGHWLVQLAGWEELMLVAAGVILLALELLVVPGFGIVGILGIIAIVASLVLSSTGPGATTAFIVQAATRVVMSVLVAMLASFVLLRLLPRLPFGRRLILERGLASAEGYASAPESDARLLGRRGRTASALRPAGIAEIDGQRVDVVSEGELLDAGQPIEVIRVDGNRIVVRQISNLPKAE